MPNPDPAAAGSSRSYDFSIPALAPKPVVPPIRLSRLAVVSIISVVFFILSGLLLLPLVGFQSDEVMFIYDLRHPQEALSVVGYHRHVLPSMLMSYLGAFKSWIYLPILGLFGSSVFAVRFPMLLLAAVTILQAGRLLRRIQGRTAAAVIVVLLSTDVVFLVTSVFDWGPVVLQNFLLVTALLWALKWYDSQRNLYAFLMGLVLGLALWNKALFLWNLSGIVVALAVLGLPLLLRNWKWKAAGLILLGLGIGSYPLLKFNLRTGGMTLKDNAHLAPAQIGDKGWYFSYAVDGQAAATANVDLANPNPDRAGHPLASAADWLSTHFGPNPSSWRFPAGLLLIAFALSVAKPAQRKWILFFTISGFLGWLQSALSPDAGRSVHHTVLFWINWYAAMALAAGCIAEWRPSASRQAVAAISAILALAGVLTIAVEYGDLLRHSPTTPWTDADAALAAKLSLLGAERAVTTDWGIANAIAVRSRDRIAVNEEVFNLNGGSFDRDEFEECKAPGCWVVTHVPEKLMLPKASQTLNASFAKEGFLESSQAVISDTHGTPTFLVFAVASQNGSTRNNTPPPPKPVVSSKPVLLATPAVIVSPGGTGRTTISWQVPAEMMVEVHIGNPDGPMFASGKGPGQSATGFWVKNGMQFFLQDVSNGKALKSENTVAQLRMEVRTR